MLPHSLSETNVSLGRPSFMEAEYDENETNDFFSDNGVILEDEEEYDVLNDETFGEPLGDEPNEPGVQPSWEDYDTHNDETFGEEISFDWEAEHDKMVSVMEGKDDKAVKPSDINETANKKLQQHMLNSEMVNRNGFCKIGSNKSYLERNDLGGAILKDNNNLTNGMKTSLRGLEVDRFINDVHNDSLEDVHRSTESMTTEMNDKMLKNDKWHRDESNYSHFSDGIEADLNSYSQDYSLFSSGTNLLQNAGIHIPSVPNTISQEVGCTTSKMTSQEKNASEELEKRLTALKMRELQTVASSFPSVGDLEKQWLNDALYKKVITADSFRAYESAFFVNNSSSTSSTNSLNSPVVSQIKPPTEPAFMKNEKFSKYYPLLMNTSIPFGQQSFPPPPPSSMMNGECDAQSMFAKMNIPNRLPPPHFDRKSFPVPVMTDSGIVMYDEALFRNVPNFGDMNAQTIGSFVNNNVLNRTKTHPGIDPTVIVSSDNLSRLPDPSMLIDNGNLPRLGMNMFQPPPGLTMDPAKFHHFQPTVALQPRPPQITSCLAMQPIQVLNGIAPDERQKQLMKFQKEERLSVVDEYAGMMTEREKYWLAGVQLLQINAMDPFKDDYYFTNYQARRRGNRGKNQTNNNNKKWQNEHTKDYLPLQFENSLGKVQVGSVVAPRKVIDTDVFETSPKHNGKLNESLVEDPMANTSHRKRRAIMLHIENLYGKIIALETLQVNSAKNKTDPATVKIECESIVNALKEDIINLRDDFKIVMSIRKGKRLVLKLLMFCDNAEAVWFQIFEILEKIIRGDQEHCMLLSYLPYFRTWLTTINLATMKRLSNYLMRNLNFHLRDKFSVSVMANMIEQAELMYFYSKAEDQVDWMEFIVTLAQNAPQSLDDIQKPVVSVKPQTLRSHLLKCEKLENGSVSNLLKIFSNNMRKP